MSGKIFEILKPPSAILFLVWLLTVLLLLSGCVTVENDGGLLPTLWVEV